MTPSDSRCAPLAFAFGLYERSCPDQGGADGSLTFRLEPCARAAPYAPAGPTVLAASELRTADLAFAVKTAARLPHFDMTRRQASLDVAARALASSKEAFDAPLGPRNLFRKLRACYRALRLLARTGLAPAGSLQHRDARPSYPPPRRTRSSGSGSRSPGRLRPRRVGRKSKNPSGLNRACALAFPVTLPP